MYGCHLSIRKRGRISGKGGFQILVENEGVWCHLKQCMARTLTGKQVPKFWSPIYYYKY